MHSTISSSPGEICPQNCYTLAEVMNRLGWSRQSYDAARRRGLKTKKSGKRIFVMGSDLIEFLVNDCPVAR